MTNLEYYKDEILKYNTTNFCDDFINPIILKQYNKNCNNNNIDCSQCQMIQLLWLREDFKKPEIDWSTVEINTLILVSSYGKGWEYRHFAKYKDGKVYAWNDGKTSFTADNPYDYSVWPYAKLAEVEE